MSILIEGMEMPKDKAIAVVIHPDGTAYRLKCSLGLCTKYLTDCEAVPVPPHGRLIDADAMIEDCHAHNSQRSLWGELEYLIDNAPTIIPADEGE